MTRECYRNLKLQENAIDIYTYPKWKVKIENNKISGSLRFHSDHRLFGKLFSYSPPMHKIYWIKSSDHDTYGILMRVSIIFISVAFN